MLELEAIGWWPVVSIQRKAGGCLELTGDVIDDREELAVELEVGGVKLYDIALLVVVIVSGGLPVAVCGVLSGCSWLLSSRRNGCGQTFCPFPSPIRLNSLTESDRSVDGFA